MSGKNIGRSEAVTQGVRIIAQSFFVPDRSNIELGQYFFAYKIEIINEGKDPVRLINRHWIITDSKGHVEEVKGAGVVGEQPRLLPSEAFDYTSACPLTVPSGNMRGTYEMIRDDGTSFLAEIGKFDLVAPFTVN